MAYECCRQTVQVDVFAFGMVVYELLSFKPPFDGLPPMKKENQIREKRRPMLVGRSIWSLAMAQDIMQMCWEQDPNRRPTMTEITEWVRREEFGRFRTEISLVRVERVSCACVFRIKPEDEQEFSPATNVQAIGNGQIPEERIPNGMSYDDCDDPRFDDIAQCVRYSMIQNYADANDTKPNILPPMSEEEKGKIVADGVAEEKDSDGQYQFLAKKRESVLSTMSQQSLLQPYTQVWVCDRKDKGLLEIFTYYDSQTGYFVSGLRFLHFIYIYTCTYTTFSSSKDSCGPFTSYYMRF